MTKRTHVVASALVAMLSIAGVAQATPIFLPGESGIYFNNYENLYRSTTNCQEFGGCMVASSGDPAGYLRVDSTIVGNINIGDIFVGVLNIQNVTPTATGTDSWNTAVGDRFTGYFAQQVAAITPESTTNVRLTLGQAVDPFGILAANEMFRLYSNASSFSSGGTIASSIASAKNGTFWASLGLGSEGYAYTRTDFTQLVSTANTFAFSALDIIAYGSGYSAGELNKVNAFNEDLAGGLIANPGNQLCSAAEIANPLISCTDFVGSSYILQNSAFQRGTSPWMFGSNDPFYLNRVPEPASLALVGLGLLGLGVVRRRKSIN